jgi:hypothetical protein
VANVAGRLRDLRPWSVGCQRQHGWSLGGAGATRLAKPMSQGPCGQLRCMPQPIQFDPTRARYLIERRP